MFAIYVLHAGYVVEYLDSLYESFFTALGDSYEVGHKIVIEGDFNP